MLAKKNLFFQRKIIIGADCVELTPCLLIWDENSLYMLYLHLIYVNTYHVWEATLVDTVAGHLTHVTGGQLPNLYSNAVLLHKGLLTWQSRTTILIQYPIVNIWTLCQMLNVTGRIHEKIHLQTVDAGWHIHNFDQIEKRKTLKKAMSAIFHLYSL